MNTEWKPIASAPKTGRTLLLGYWNSHGKWRTVRGQWMSLEYIAEHWEDPDEAEAGWFETAVDADDAPNCWAVTPSHWQPMPEPPCATCNGHGMIGGPSFYAPDEGGEPCLDCSPPAPTSHPIPTGATGEDERKAFETEMADPLRKLLGPGAGGMNYWNGDEYDSAYVQAAWFAWKARAAIGAPAAGDALDGLVDRLAGMAYSFAVRLDQATRGANGDELEGVARRVTADLKAEIRAAIAQQSQRKEA
jgi:hypothetical protein